MELHRLYDTYVIDRSSTLHDLSSKQKVVGVSNTTICKGRVGSSSRSTLASMYMEFDQFLHRSCIIQSEKCDLEVYLEEPPKQEDDLDILEWWNNNSSKYPILSLMACDILTIPLSTVPSESAFSTRSKVLNKYRSSLDLMTIQALIRIENWLRDNVESIDVSEEDSLSTVFASSKLLEEDEEHILQFPNDESFEISSSFD